MAKKNKQIARLSGRSFLNGGLTPPKLYREDIDELIRQQEREKKKKQAVGLIPQFIPNDRIVTDLKTADLTDEEYNQAVQMAQKRNQMMSVQSPIPKDLDEFEKWYQDTSGIDLKTTTEDEQLDIYADRHRKKNGVDVDNMTYAEVLSDYEGLNDEISELEKQISQRQTIKDHPVNGYGKTAEKFYAKNSEQLDLIQKRKQELEQKKEFYDEILNDKDFHKKALETDDDGKWAKDNVPNFSALEYFNSLLDIQKDPTKSEEEKNSAAMKQIVWGVLASPKVALGEDVLMYAFVSPEEREIYNSIHSHYGKEEAERYFSTIKDDVLQREADFMVDQMMESDNGWTNNPVFRSLFSFKSRHEGGLKGFLQDIRLLSGDTEPVEKSAYEYAYDEMRPQLTGVEGFANDLVGGLGNNLPASSASLATFLVTGGNLDAAQAVGSSVTAIQVFGESFRQAKQEEKADEEAYLYATLEALKEAGLEYAIGGDLFFSSGGTSKALKNTKIGSKVMEALKNGSEALIKNPVARRTAKNGLDLLVHAGDEFVEEATQEATEPLVRNIAFGEENEFELWNDQIAYAGLLGAGTSAVHNTAYRAVENSSIKSAGKQIKSSGQVQEAVQAGFKAAEGGKAWELAQDISKKQAAGKTPSDYEVGLLGSYLQEERTQKQAAPEQEMELEPSENTGGEITLNPDTYAQTQTRLTEMGVDKQAAAVQAKAIERLKLGDTSAIHTILESPEAKQLLARDTGVVFGTTPEQGRRAAGEIAARAQSQAGRIRQEIQPEQAASTVRQNDQQQTDTSAMQPMDHMTERETATAILPAESPALQPQTASAQQGFVPDPVMESGQSAPLKTVSEVRKPQAVWADSGEPVQVTGIQSAQNGELYVRADSDSGSTVVRASDLSYQSPEVELIYQTAAQLGTSGAKAFVYGYQPGSSFDSYYKGFMRAYHAGTANTPFEQIGSAYTAMLPKETARRAYYAGQNDQTERFTNAGERSTIKTKQVKDVTYTYQAVPEGRRSENAGTIVRELELLGLSGEAIEPGLQVRQNGKMRTSQGDASTLKNGHVVVRNDTDANPKNAAAHEAFHAWWNLKLPEANAYFDAVTNGNIDFSSESFNSFSKEIIQNYFDESLSVFDIVENQLFQHEFAAFVSGALYEDTTGIIQSYPDMFYDWEMVETAWQKMIEAGKGRKQDGQGLETDRTTLWMQPQKAEQNVGREGTGIERSIENDAEKTGRTPEAESGRPRSIPQVEREGRPGNEGISGQRSLLGLESSEAEGGAGKGRKQDGQGLGRDYGSQGFELGGEDSENPGRRGPMAGNGEIVAEGTGRTPEAESGRPRSIPQVEREGRPGNEGIYGQRSLLGLESSETEGGAGKGQQGQTTGLAQNEAAKKLKGSQRAYLHVLGKLSNSRIVLDDTIQGGRANGYYDLDTGEIHIALDAVDSAYDFVAKHELTHQLQQLSPEHYRQYFDHVVSYLNQAEPDAFDKLVQKQLDGYREMGKKITRQQAMDEVVADASDAFLRDSAAIRDLVSQNRTLGQKVLDAIRSMIRKIDQYLRTHKTLHTDAARLLSRNKKALEEAQRLWTNALLSAQKNTARKNSSADGDVRFSKKLGGYNPDISVSTKDIQIFKIQDIKNIKEVKQKVYNYLKQSYISTEDLHKPIVNIDTGMSIEIRRKGINETFGNDKAYHLLSTENKKIKLATMTSLAKMIKYGEVRSAEAANYHNPNSSVTFAYLTSPITIDGKNYQVEMDIRKAAEGNQFYIHKIKIADEAPKHENQSPAKLNTSSATTNIPQEDTGVNDSISKNDKNVRFSIKRDADGKKVVVVDTDQGIFVGVNEKNYARAAKQYIDENFRNQSLPLSEYGAVYLDKTGSGKYLYSGQKLDTKTNRAKMKAATELDNLLEASEWIRSSEDRKAHKFASLGFDYYRTIFIVDGQVFEGIIDIGISSKGATYYGMTNIKKVTSDSGKYLGLLLDHNKSGLTSRGNLSTTNIPQEDTGVNDSISKNNKNVRFSIKRDADGNRYVQVDEDILEGIPKKDWVKVVKNNLTQKFPDGVSIGNELIKVTSRSRKELTMSVYSQNAAKFHKLKFHDKMAATNYLDELVKISEDYVGEGLKHLRKDDFIEFARGTTKFKIGENGYTAEIIVGITKKQNTVLYDIVNLKREDIQKKEIKKVEVTNTAMVQTNAHRDRSVTSTTTNVSQKDTGVNDSISKNDKNVRFSINPNFTREYDAWDKKKANGYFYIGTTSEALQSIGIEDKKIRWDKGKIIRIKNKHPQMTDLVIKQVPNLLEHPIIIMQSNTVMNRVVLLGEIYTQNGTPVLAALELQPSAIGTKVADYIKIASAYDKTGIQNLMNVSDILYLDPDKKRTTTWFRGLGLQLPSVVTKFGSIGRVTYVDRKVNGSAEFGNELPQKTAIQLAFEQAENPSKSSISDAGDKNTEKHFSLKNVSKLESENLIERYTQTEYNDYGWVAVNEVLTPSELRKLNTQFADMLHGEKFSKNRDGYYIIPVGEENRPQNSFVFIKGTISHPKISQILRIDVENEAELDIIRGDFGERRNFESREIIEAIYGQETVYQYSAGDFEDYQTLRNQGQTAGLRRNAGSNRGVSDGGRDQSGNLGSLQDKDQVTFSLKNVSKLDYDNLIKENKKQKEMISLLEEQFQVTKGIKWDKASIDRTAQRILKQYDSTYSVQDLSENLTSLYGYLKNNPDTNTDEVHSVVTAMSKSVLEHSRKLDDAMYQEYKELRDRIRGTRLTLSDADKADLDRAGGYHQFRRDNFGRLNLTNQGIPVDVFYQELQTLYPEFFAGEEIAHPADQLIRIAEVLDTIRPVYVNPYGMNLDEAAGVLANELLESYVDIPQAKPTYADRELQKRKKLKLEYQKKIREIKAEYKAKYEEKLKEVNRQNILNIRKIQEQLKKTAAADRETIKKLERQVERLKKYNQNITHAKTAAMSVSPVTSVSVPVKKSDSSVPMKQVISAAPSYVEAAKQYGTIPKGESPVRDVAVPAQTGENARVRQFARTAIEAGATPDGMISEFEREILNGAFDYNPISDKTAQREAELTLSKKGFDGALKQWKGALKNQKAASKDDIVLAEKLYVQAAKEGNYKLAMELAAEIAEEGTRAGQTVQAMRLLNKMSGEGQLVYIERTVDRMNQDLKSRRKKGKAPYLEIPQEMKETLLQSKTREEIDRAAEDIYRQLASQLPVTLADKWNAWRYLSMLGNPRTHVRNLTGNAVFLPAVKMKNLIATGLEHVYRKAGGEIERTKAFRATKESLDFAKKDYEMMADIIAGGGKMNPSDVIRDYQKIFPFKTLEKARKFNFNALEAEDRIFLKRYYVSALAGYMTANQIDPNAFVSQQILERARNYAIQEAQKATYRDASKVAGMLQHLSKTNSALGLLVEGVLPFKKTPVNILKRGVEYSPAGLLYSLTMGAKKVKTGKITAAEYIDSIASGLSGTVLFALGALLQSLGILRGGEDDDKKKEQFDRNMGYQPYSLQIGDISYTIDWLAPSSLPLFVGARVFETLTEEQEDYSVSSFAEDLQMIAEPVLSLSMLSGLNDTLSSVSYGDNGISDIAANVLASYFGQAVPTLFGQAARTVDGTRRTTYTDKNVDIPSDLQYFFQKNQNKIPAASMLFQPYIDLWGREDTQENILIRAFENFVSPGYLNAVETSAVEQELVFIYEETGDAGVFPSKAAKYFQVDGQRKDLTAQEYTMFAKAKGQKAYSLLWEMMATQAYREASAQEKAELIADVYEYATVFGKTQVSAYSTNGWKAKALQADQNGESVVEVILNRKRG
jgi:hypothetical protein